MSDPSRISSAWNDDRSDLIAIARRIVADETEAEDVVQDAFVRLTLQRIEDIDDVRAWLIVVVRRLALDRLTSAHGRLSTPVATTGLADRDTEPVADPAERVTLDDEVRYALDLVLDRLSPAQRTPFLLHDVFGVPYAQIAEIVGRTPGACRQLASEARRAVRAERPPRRADTPDPAVADIARRFVAASSGGDLHALLRLLDPEVTGSVTVDGERIGWARGSRAAAERTLYFLGPRSPWQLATIPIDDGVGVLATRRGDPVFVGRLDLAADGRIRDVRGVVLPRQRA